MFSFDSRGGRPVERVTRIAGLLRDLWVKYPQLRLGQLLVNVDKRFETNPFFIEDDEAEAAIRKVLDTGFGSA